MGAKLCFPPTKRTPTEGVSQHDIQDHNWTSEGGYIRWLGKITWKRTSHISQFNEYN